MKRRSLLQTLAISPFGALIPSALDSLDHSDFLSKLNDLTNFGSFGEGPRFSRFETHGLCRKSRGLSVYLPEAGEEGWFKVELSDRQWERYIKGRDVVPLFAALREEAERKRQMIKAAFDYTDRYGFQPEYLV